MPRWFLSYHSAEHTLASQLQKAIEQRDSAVTVLFAPDLMRAGGSWSAQLADEIADSEAFILLIGREGVGDWQVPEYLEALDRWVRSKRTYPLIVVLVEGQTAPGLPFLRQIHWIVAADPASGPAVGRIVEAGHGKGRRIREMWRYTNPYRGLEAMEEKDSEYFFGRAKETIDVLDALVTPGLVPVLIGNSGVGKSSLAKAGVLAALKRQSFPEGATSEAKVWPIVFKESRRWCYLSLRPGVEPLSALVDAFIQSWQIGAIDARGVTLRREWFELLESGKATLSNLMDATERRYRELHQLPPPGFLLYVDQGEELYVLSEARQRERFSEILVASLRDGRLYVLASMRSDFLGELQKDRPLFKVRRQIDVVPLGEEQLREVVGRPAELLKAKFETDRLIEVIARRAADDSIKDVGALPLLSYSLDDMWTQMVRRGDGTLRLPIESFELGGVLVKRATDFVERNPANEALLRRVLTLRCANIRDDGEPTRRRAAREEFSDAEWKLVSGLAAEPYRLLVIITKPTGETHTEIAHEAIFRRWDKLREWIAGEREFLAWRSGLESARRVWEAAPVSEKKGALLMGLALAKARNWLAKRADDLSEIDQRFIAASRRLAQRRQLGTRTLVAASCLLVLGFTVWLNASHINAQWRYYRYTLPFMTASVLPHVLSAEAESGLKKGNHFRECAEDSGKDDCPEMIVIGPGYFFMGSDGKEYEDEAPVHKVNFTHPIAVSKYVVTFDEWNACAFYGDCASAAADGGRQGQYPVTNVSYDDAQRYVAWWSRMTGRHYRLLTEAEYEFAAHGDTQWIYPWGNEIGDRRAHCRACGTEAAFGDRTAPVGSFEANGFGLYDMVGNVWQMVEDCYGPYPSDDVGTVTKTEGCSTRILRGGSFADPAGNLRITLRLATYTGGRSSGIGFRVVRELSTR